MNESHVPQWLFQVEGNQLKIFFGALGSQSEVAAWRLDGQTRLVLGDNTTEWITAESFARVMDQAVQMTAKIIVDVETGATEIARGSWSYHRVTDACQPT